MGLLLKLVTLPVSAPVGGVMWVAEQVRAAAEREFYDEATIREQLADVEQRFEAGEIAEAEYDDAVDELFRRLLEARELRGGQQPEGVDDALEVQGVDEERSDE